MSMARDDIPAESRTWRQRDDQQMSGVPHRSNAGFIWVIILAALFLGFYAAFGL
jgi:hypothetical protein